jgi:Cu(I)/Ag(I) efflux system membrane protein CusA/SilA
MPTTLPNVSIAEAKKSLQIQDRILKSIPEVETVYGKVGRAETATDPAPLSMVETVIRLKPKKEWRTIKVKRFYSDRLPDFLKPPLRVIWPEERTLSMKELVAEMDDKVSLPGWTDAWTMPIKTRIDMLTTGIKTPVGIKILGPDLGVIEDIGKKIEGKISNVEGVRSVYSERSMGGLYVDIVPDREKAARYGLNVADIQDVIETSIGGRIVGVTVDGRNRFSINVRYPGESRESLESLKEVLVGKAPAMSGGAGPVPYVTLGQVADINVVEGPPMIKDEDGMLAGTVFIDVDTSERDIGGFVKEAKAVLDKEITVPSGYRLHWTGQYELMTQMNDRLKIAVPVALIIIVLLLYLNFKSPAKILIVLLSLPFALVGSVWLMHLTGSNLSTATWVGIIAILGLAAETGIVMIVYLDLAYERRLQEGTLHTRGDIVEAVIEGAVGRVRPKMMTVLTTFIGLVPLLWATGSGADVMRRLAIPLIGGLVTSLFLTLIIIPVIYAAWRRAQLRLGAGLDSNRRGIV